MFIKIQRKSLKPVYRQIYETLREKILSGELSEDERLPSSRELASLLGLSRKPVLEAYDLLLSEGYVQSKRGAGTYVSGGLVLRKTRPADVFQPEPVGFRPYRTDIIDFRSGLPDLAWFPMHTWQPLMNQVLQQAKPADLSYQAPEGRLELREAVSDYLAVTRGVESVPEQILITSGTTQAIGIISQFLLHNGETAAVEDPVTSDIPKIIRSRGGLVLPVPVDEEGMQPAGMEGTKPSCIFLTPSHQYPLGSVMPAGRRLEWLKTAKEWNAYIIEDDYDSEFRYSGPPVSSLQGLAPEQVIYMGTFSKTLFPALRTAYIILPPGLVGRAREAKWITDLHNASLNQIALARFISSGAYQRHISKMRKIYRRKRDALLEELSSRFGSGIGISGESTGLHLCARFPGRSFTPELLSRLEDAGVRVYPVSEHTAGGDGFMDTVIIGFGMLDEQQIRRGINLLYTCLG